LISALRAIDDKQAAVLGTQATFDQVVQQRLHHGGVLGDTLQQAKRVFGTAAVDADRGKQCQLIADVHAVDLDRQQIEL
jgi:hypothetical protein